MFLAQVHPLQQKVIERVLRAASIESRIRAGDLEIRRDGGTTEALRIYDLLLKCHEQILAEAKRQNIKVEMYKPFEPEKCLAAIASSLGENADGNARLARLLHELIWAQGFPNTNHRSTLLLIHGLMPGLGIPRIDPAVHVRRTDEYLRESKRLIPEQEHSPDPSRAKAEHFEASRRYLADIQLKPNRGTGR